MMKKKKRKKNHFFYLQVDHGSEKTDKNNSGSNYVPDNYHDPQEESTDGGIVQLPAVCQSESSYNNSIDYDYADDDNSDPDYVPDSDPQEESDGDIFKLPSVCQLEPGGKNMMQRCYDSDAQSEVSEIIPNVTVQQPCTSGNLGNITVLKHNNIGKKRKWDKKHSCLYCCNLYSKMARHLEQKHQEELEVVQAISYNKGSKERKRLFKIIQNRGDFKHNKSVKTSNEGFLIPVKRQANVGQMDDFTTCDKCLGLFFIKDLWRHKKKCPALEPGEKPIKHVRNTNLLFLCSDSSTETDIFTEKILNSMKPDRIALLCRQDKTILEFGRGLFSKAQGLTHQYQYIRHRMREMARFVMEMRNHCEVQYLCDCFSPLLFSTVIKVVKTLSSFNEETGLHGTPSIGLKMGHSLKACASIVKCLALQSGESGLEKKADDFITLYKHRWSQAISSRAMFTLHKRKFNATRRIPLAEDVQKLYQHLQSTCDKARESLTASPNPTSWKDMAEASLGQIILFNRRRGGEMERMTVQDYEKGLVSGKTLQGEILESLSSFEKTLAKNLERVEIYGKRGRRVPVLLTKSHKYNIDMLLDFRESSGLNIENNYLFGRQGECNSSLRVCDILRKYSLSCGASQPELLTSTALRKHIGTICQLLNLKEHELEALATFMGHDKSVHHQYYRLPEDTMQLAKVSKILLQMEKGNMKVCKGKSLDDIEMISDEVIDEEELCCETDIVDDMSIDNFQNGRNEPRKKSEHLATSSSSDTIPCTVEKSPRQPTGKKQWIRKQWSSEEKSAVKQDFGSYFYLNRLPGKDDIEKTIRNNPVLANRPWKQIKYFIKNAQGKNNFK